MAKINIPEVDCLYCRVKGACITDSDKIETVDNIIVRPIICQKCGRGWKDFYGDSNDTSPVLSIQRDKHDNNNRSDNKESNDQVSGH